MNTLKYYRSYVGASGTALIINRPMGIRHENLPDGCSVHREAECEAA